MPNVVRPKDPKSSKSVIQYVTSNKTARIMCACAVVVAIGAGCWLLF